MGFIKFVKLLKLCVLRLRESDVFFLLSSAIRYFSYLAFFRRCVDRLLVELENGRLFMLMVVIFAVRTMCEDVNGAKKKKKEENGRKGCHAVREVN